jgi:magnesium chelatase family protein
VRERVLRARHLQRERARALGLRSVLNATLPSSELEQVVVLDDECRRLIDRRAQELGFSARAFAKILRVARTIADLEGAPLVDARHLTDAIQGRLLDRSDGDG